MPSTPFRSPTRTFFWKSNWNRWIDKKASPVEFLMNILVWRNTFSICFIWPAITISWSSNPCKFFHEWCPFMSMMDRLLHLCCWITIEHPQIYRLVQKDMNDVSNQKIDTFHLFVNGFTDIRCTEGWFHLLLCGFVDCSPTHKWEDAHPHEYLENDFFPITRARNAHSMNMWTQMDSFPTRINNSMAKKS